MVSVKSFFGDVSTPSFLPSALPKAVAVFRAHLKLEVVAGGWGGERRRDAVHCQSPAEPVSRRLLLSRQRNSAWSNVVALLTRLRQVPR